MSAKRWLIVGAIAVGLIALVAWNVSARPHFLTLVVCDIGQGDAILLQAPNGNDILIDGGRPDSKVLACLGRHMVPWNRTIELVVLTHPHSDHVGGLPAVAARYSVGQVVDSGVPADSAVYRAWRSAMERQHMPEKIVGAGEYTWFSFGSLFFWVSLATTPLSILFFRTVF